MRMGKFQELFFLYFLKGKNNNFVKFNFKRFICVDIMKYIGSKSQVLDFYIMFMKIKCNFQWGIYYIMKQCDNI